MRYQGLIWSESPSSHTLVETAGGISFASNFYCWLSLICQAQGSLSSGGIKMSILWETSAVLSTSTHMTSFNPCRSYIIIIIVSILQIRRLRHINWAAQGQQQVWAEIWPKWSNPWQLLWACELPFLLLQISTTYTQNTSTPTRWGICKRYIRNWVWGMHWQPIISSVERRILIGTWELAAKLAKPSSSACWGRIGATVWQESHGQRHLYLRTWLSMAWILGKLDSHEALGLCSCSPAVFWADAEDRIWWKKQDIEHLVLYLSGI